MEAKPTRAPLHWGMRVLIVAILALLIQVPPVVAVLIRRALITGRGNVPVLVLGYLLVFGALIAVSARIFRDWRHWRPRRQGIWSRLGWIVGGYLVVALGQMVLGSLNQLLYHQTTTANNQTITTLMGHQPLMIGLLSFSAVVLSPLAEELIFRGILMNFFFPARAVWRPLFLSALVFSLEHASTTPVSYLIYFFIGAVFAYVYRRTGRLSNSIALHTLNNLVATIVLFA